MYCAAQVLNVRCVFGLRLQMMPALAANPCLEVAAQWLADSTPQASLSAVYKASSVAAVVVPPRAASSEADVPGGADRKSQQEALGIAQKASM